jgi:hypothetical protein
MLRLTSAPKEYRPQAQEKRTPCRSETSAQCSRRPFRHNGALKQRLKFRIGPSFSKELVLVLQSIRKLVLQLASNHFLLVQLSFHGIHKSLDMPLNCRVLTERLVVYGVRRFMEQITSKRSVIANAARAQENLVVSWRVERLDTTNFRVRTYPGILAQLIIFSHKLFIRDNVNRHARARWRSIDAIDADISRSMP